MSLHTPEISTYTAHIAKKLAIRKIIKSFQISYIKRKKKVVLEGRDGSKIFPKANVKFYVVCSPLKIAANRRLKQIKKVNKKITFKEVLKVYINTAKLSINGVIKKMCSVINTQI